MFSRLRSALYRNDGDRPGTLETDLGGHLGGLHGDEPGARQGDDSGDRPWWSVEFKWPVAEPLPAGVPGCGDPIRLDALDRLVAVRRPTPDELAERFVQWLRSHTQLRGQIIGGGEIEVRLLPRFCEALGWPIPCWRDFANALTKPGRMCKKRMERGGERFTIYVVPD